MQIEINLEGLRREIIEQTTKVSIYGEKPIKVNPVNSGPFGSGFLSNRITVEVPTDVGDGPLVIAFMNEEGKTLAELGYDQKEEKFPY